MTLIHTLPVKYFEAIRRGESTRVGVVAKSWCPLSDKAGVLGEYSADVLFL